MQLQNNISKLNIYNIIKIVKLLSQKIKIKNYTKLSIKFFKKF